MVEMSQKRVSRGIVAVHASERAVEVQEAALGSDPGNFHDRQA